MGKYETLKEIVIQLLSCNYECEGVRIENNAAFIQLVELAENNSNPLDAQVMKKAMGEMNNCFLCGSQAHWQKCNKRWGIFCDGCRAMTGYYDKKEDALKHWNNEYPLKQKPTEEQMNNMIKLMRER